MEHYISFFLEITILNTVPIDVDGNDEDVVKNDDLAAIAGDAIALILSTECKETPENKENANSKYDKLFSGNEEDLKNKLKLDNNQKYFLADFGISSNLLKKIEGQILAFFKAEKSHEVLDNLNKLENIKIIRSKELSLEKETAVKLIMDDSKEDTEGNELIETLAENICLIILLTGELDEAVTDLLIKKQGPSLDILGSIFAI